MINRNKKLKNIIVKSAGVLKELNGAIGPILTPFRCDIRIIKDLVNNGKDVYEVDGSRQVKLTVRNYEDTDLLKPTPVKKSNDSSEKIKETDSKSESTSNVEQYDADVQENKHKENKFYNNDKQQKNKNKNK